MSLNKESSGVYGKGLWEKIVILPYLLIRFKGKLVSVEMHGTTTILVPKATTCKKPERTSWAGDRVLETIAYGLAPY